MDSPDVASRNGAVPDQDYAWQCASFSMPSGQQDTAGCTARGVLAVASAKEHQPPGPDD